MEVERAVRGWRGEIDELANTCAMAQAADEVALVGQMIALLARADDAALQILPLQVDFDRLRTWLRSGATLSAMSSLLGSSCGYMLSRSSDGGAMATIVVAGRDAEFSSFGETESIALCGAICSAMASMQMVPPSGGVLH